MVGQAVQTGTTPFLVNVCDYGANGNRDTADPTANTTAIQDAFNAALAAPNAFSATVYFPPGQYLVNGPITLNSGALEGGLTIMGSGRRSSFLLWTNDTPILQFDCTATTMSSVTITDMGFFYQGSAGCTTAYAVSIYGTQSQGFERALFKGLGFYGPMTAAISSWKTDGSTNYIYSFAVRWSVFDDIDFDNGGQSAPPNRCLWFKNSSGTGNIFSNFTGGGTASIIEIGDGYCNCGDMLIQGIQGGYGADMIKLTGGSNYMERVSILNCQADGEVGNGLNLVGMGQFAVRNFLWGGATSWNLQNCYDYVIEGTPGKSRCQQAATHRGYKFNNTFMEEHETAWGVQYGGAQTAFTIKFPGGTGYPGNQVSNGGNNTVQIDVVAHGVTEDGAPATYRLVGAIVQTGGGTPTFLPYSANGSGIVVTVSPSTSGTAIKVGPGTGHTAMSANAVIKTSGSAHWVATPS